MLKLSPITSGLELQLLGALPIDPADLREIDALWQQALAGRPTLFDGPMLTVREIAPDRLLLAEISYRHVVAAQASAAIRERLGLRGLAVSGILNCPDGLVFGRRGGMVTSGTGRWELVPSGGVTPPKPDLARQVLLELEEEIGLSAAQVRVAAPVALIEQPGLLDVALPLSTDLSASEIKSLHRDRGSAEYDELFIGDLPNGELVPESRAIIEAGLAKKQ